MLPKSIASPFREMVGCSDHLKEGEQFANDVTRLGSLTGRMRLYGIGSFGEAGRFRGSLGSWQCVEIYFPLMTWAPCWHPTPSAVFFLSFTRVDAWTPSGYHVDTNQMYCRTIAQTKCVVRYLEVH